MKKQTTYRSSQLLINDKLPKGVFIEVRECSAYEETFFRAVLEEREDWRTAIAKFLSDGQLPSDPVEARKIQHRSLRF
ncbi:hypothetical protein LIER_04547 [Lithospermum erythrorhizon]|uniref:Uncharacterized protein n=1 Tax=Lithospermum erythrorhizon TaxID=34254 RepID=A0AAV3NYR4_LITER